jgi:predicted amidohydrolase YtcJ
MIASQSPASAAEESAADLILTHAHVYTLSPDEPEADAVVIRQGRIVFVGSADAARRHRGARTRVMDLWGAVVIPGLVDAHAHLLSLGRSLWELNLVGTKSKEEIRRIVIERRKTAVPGEWISGRGWDQNDWREKDFPTAEDLAGTDDHPVYLRRVDGHAVWVNREALERCGITGATPDPPGGRILRDAEGNPTGVFLDNAAELVRRHMPVPTLERQIGWAKAALRECNRVGLTGVHDAGVDSTALEVYRALRRSGELTLRIYAMLDDADPDWLERHWAAGPEIEDDLLTVRAVKLYADGALGSRGAALLEPYSDDPGNRGIMVNPPEYLERMTRQAVVHGFQVCTHAIGDAANRAVLDVYQRVLERMPKGDYRLRIEHAQVLAPEDLPRFARWDVIASMQPTHATSDMNWAEERLGAERMQYAYAWRKLIRNGARLAFGSDFPVESPDPLAGIYAAVTRQDREGNPAGGWYPEERLSVQEAVAGFTAQAAYAGFAEGERGTIEPGKQADLVVLDRDLFISPPEEILRAKVLYTIVGGRIVYAADEGNSDRMRKNGF